MIDRPTRRRTRRVYALAIALVTAVAGAVTLTPAAEATPAPSAAPVVLEGGFELVSATELQREDGTSYITGQIINRTGRTVEHLGVGIDQLDEAGNVVWPVFGSVLGRYDDGELIRFRSDTLMGSGPYSWAVRRVWSQPARWPANLNFTTTVTGQFVDDEGFHHILGTVRNDNTVCGCNVDVRVTMAVTYLDAAGRAVGLGSGQAGDLSAVAWVWPGETATFETRGYPLSAYASFELRAEGQGSPMPLPTVVTSTGGSGTVRSGDQFTLSATVAARGAESIPARNAEVELIRRRPGTTQWETVGFEQADDYGRVTFRYTPWNSAEYRVQVRESDRVLASTAPATHVVNVQGRVGKPKITAGYRDRPANDLPFYLRFPVVPSGRGHTVVLQRRIRGEWRKVASRPTNAQGIANFLFKKTPTGKYTFRAVLKSSSLILGATGPSVTVKVGGPWAG